jgi:hypothetical protein
VRIANKTVEVLISDGDGLMVVATSLGFALEKMYFGCKKSRAGHIL